MILLIVRLLNSKFAHYNHLFQMGRGSALISNKEPLNYDQKKCHPANRPVLSISNLPKAAPFSKCYLKNCQYFPQDVQNLCPNSLSKGSSLKTLKTAKGKLFHFSNPQIKPRKTAPCFIRNSNSIQYPKTLSLNSKEKYNTLLSKPAIKSKEKTALKSKEKGLKISKGKTKICLTSMKCTKKRQTSNPHQSLIVKKQYLCNKPKRLQRKTEELIVSLKKCSKKKSQLTHQTHEQLPKNNGTKLIYQSKSSCITRNISRNNSKQKEYFKQDVGAIFKKKRIKNEQNKLKKQAVYTSMRISKRGSFKFFQTQKDHYLVLNKDENKARDEPYGQLKANNLAVKLTETKSLRNLDLLAVEGMQVDDVKKDFLFGYVGKESNFSFKHKRNSKGQNKNVKEQKGQNTNVHEISIDNFLECREGSFRLESEQSLKERLTRVQLSLEQIKQQQFPSLQQIQILNEYQQSLESNSHYPLCDHLQASPPKPRQSIDYPTERQPLIQRLQTIDWLSILASTMLLTTQTFQLAVAYLDVYCFGRGCFEQGTHIQELRLIAATCLALAIKMDERQLEHDIFNAFETLSVGFTREQIVQTESQIVKRLKLKLKITTLSFWLDYLSSLWDQHLTHSSYQQESQPNFYFKSLHGLSYQNYRKALEISNSILFDGPSPDYEPKAIVLSILFVICEENIHQLHLNKVFQQIDNFSRNLHTSAQRTHRSAKQNIPAFATQETLDELSNSGLQQNNPSHSKSRQTNLVKSKISQCIARPSIDRSDPFKTRQKFLSTFETFAKKYTDRNMKQLSNVIEYGRQFSELKFVLEVDPRVYEQAQTYEDFMRYHSYSPHAKLFVGKRIEERTKCKL